MVQLLHGVRALSYTLALSSFWAIYSIYENIGLFAAIVAFIFFSFIYGMGPAPMFAVAASILHFKFNVVPLWAATASYIWAAFTLALQLFIRALAVRQVQSNQPQEPT
jgi:hypothetical protein